MKKTILTKDAPAPIGPYSQAVESNGILYISGQIPMDPYSGEMISGDIKKERIVSSTGRSSIVMDAGIPN